MQKEKVSKKRVFNGVDRLAFAMATLVTLVVYCLTIGPSVGLEDSGELATASAHLGVPHPPGYPFWSMCTWLFCKIFRFVTYMGHPTPAWAVSLASAIFGALAAGCTAMLISRSAQDFLKLESKSAADAASSDTPLLRALCFGGAVGGALAFAFSPVEWSQATIVEIYSLNSLFLMWVLLLSYKWMRAPTNTTLWATAFIFGLGLTNYQALLFAIVPLALIIALRNVPLFRDFALYLIPVVLTFQVLDVGSLDRAQAGMERDSIAKHAPAGLTDEEYSVLLLGPYYNLALNTPSEFETYQSRVQQKVRELRMQLLPADPVKAQALRQERTATEAHARMVREVGRLSRSMSPELRRKIADGTLQREGAPLMGLDSLESPLLKPGAYVFVAVWCLLSVLAALVGVRGEERARKKALYASAALALGGALTAYAVSAPSFDLASAFGYGGEPYVWAKSTFLFAAVVVALFALSAFVKNGLFYAVPVAGFHLALFILLRNGAMNGLTHPATGWFWWPFVWNFVVMALVWNILPNGRSVVGAAFFTQLGVAFYTYMPLVSEGRNPPMNWGYPRTWEGFKHAITRGQYEQITAEQFASVSAFLNFFKVQMGHYFSDVKMQFTDFLAFLALVPFACWHLRIRKNRRARFVRLLEIAAALLAVLLLIECTTSTEPGTWGAALENALLGVLGLLALCGCLIVAVKQFVFRPALALRHFIDNCRAAKNRVPLVALGVLGAELLLVPVVLTFRFGVGGKPGFFVVLWLAAMVFLVVNMRSFVRLNRRLRHRGVTCDFGAKDVTQQWLISSGACFLMMSVLFIILAKVVGDVQDGFIQKVKFIASHAMIALWIGYGLVFVAVLVLRLLPARLKKPLAVPLVLLLILGAALPPVYQNYFGDISSPDNVVFQLGGAEQNGHTFGWQFGAYQLDGAKAIRAQLEAEEEPLPDPDWPEPMEDHAFFFGGTDPGRFVPTYMIYAAEYRPDVYLITQNALADGTYMSVERDLYGDEIWIPSSSDNSRAFEEFTMKLTPEEKAYYGVDTSNGRVQVTGANSVMKINEILARRMFEKNRDRHAFYIEESYPMNWMYDYLTPHGLIMRVEKAKHQARSTNDVDGNTVVPIDWTRLRRKDMDFWDWYTRRLLDDPMFRRDFAAQKSFAKLRSAIGGVYLHLPPLTGLEAGFQAYREACLLAPISPESTFHYMQLEWTSRKPNSVGCYVLPLANINVIEDLLDFIDRMDPNNKRTRSTSGFNWREMIRVWRELYAAEAVVAALGDKATAADYERAAFANAAQAASDTRWTNAGVARAFQERAAQFMARALPGLTTPDALERAIPVLLDSRRQAAAVVNACQRYRTQTGRSTTAVDLALVKGYYRLNQKDRAFRLLSMLIRTKPQEIERACQTDAEIGEIITALNESLNKKSE